MQYRKISGPLILSQQSSGRKQTFHSDNLSLDYFLTRKLQPTLFPLLYSMPPPWWSMKQCSLPFHRHAHSQAGVGLLPPPWLPAYSGTPCMFTCCWLKVKVLATQSCPTLYGPMDCIRVGSSFHGISQARILDWIAISFSGGSSQPRDQPRSSALQVDSFIWGTRKLLAESSLMETQNPSLGSGQL